MDTEKKLVIAEQVCEFAIGFVVGGIINAVAQPKGFVNKTLTLIGSSAIAFVAGRAFNKEFVDVCDQVFDVDLSDKFI